MVIIAALAAAVVVALIAGYLVGERAGRRWTGDGAESSLEPAAAGAVPPAPASGTDEPEAVPEDGDEPGPAGFMAGRPAVVVLPRPAPAPAAVPDEESFEGLPESEELPEEAPAAVTEVATLWDLELARVEREWRIATVPLDVPVVDAQGPGGRLRAALQMELERHREQSGGDALVDGAAADGLSPSVALATLRLTQEAVAELGRLSDRLTVELAGDEDTARVTVRARGADVPPGFADWLAAAATGLGAGSKVTRGPEAVVEITVPAAPPGPENVDASDEDAPDGSDPDLEGHEEDAADAPGDLPD